MLGNAPAYNNKVMTSNSLRSDNPSLANLSEPRVEDAVCTIEFISSPKHERSGAYPSKHCKLTSAPVSVNRRALDISLAKCNAALP